jgi:succinylarginine dihydrolase
MYQEINFDGIVGPTHNFAGLSEGNMASLASRALVSRPREAALQGLRKMKALAERGIPQAVLPPLERPSIPWLRSFGIRGETDADVLTTAAQDAPNLLSACSSASSMWTANAATMTPSCDSEDGKVHFTPANLSSKLHRAIEAPETHRMLRTLFADVERFIVHPPLAGGEAMRDEGAANHTRLAADFSSQGTHVFVYGASVSNPDLARPKLFPARQTLEACQAVARLHRIPAGKAVFVQQDPLAIDAGVFHNDVIAVGHLNLLLHHESAFAAGDRAIDAIKQACGHELVAIRVSEAEVPLATAVKSYLFNSQIVSRPEGGMVIIAPQECAETAATQAWLQRLVAAPDNPVVDVQFFNLRESMRNGGGPACLRQRITMNDAERAAMRGRVMLDAALSAEIEAWVQAHYREELHFSDLIDPQFLNECRVALDQLTSILRLGPIFSFQLE